MTLHLIAAVIWVGGMFFAHMILRPSAVEQLEPPFRLPLWSSVFKRFFFWVWIAVITILVTGYWMIDYTYNSFAVLFGIDIEKTVFYIQAMHLLGLIMTIIFTSIFFGPYQDFKKAVNSLNFPEGGKHINRIRQLVTINLILGLLTSIIASMGVYVHL
jgi:uncharacterized membrane protein